jgi:hypothetical protein
MPALKPQIPIIRTTSPNKRRNKMFKNTMKAIEKTAISPKNAQIIMLILTIVLFILGAGAPGAHGGLGG